MFSMARSQLQVRLQTLKIWTKYFNDEADHRNDETMTMKRAKGVFPPPADCTVNWQHSWWNVCSHHDHTADEDHCGDDDDFGWPNARVNIQSAIIVDRGCTYNRLRLRICVNMSMLCIEEGPCVCILHTMKMCVHCTIQCIYTVHYTIQCINTMDLLNNTSFLYRRHPSLNRGLQLITSYWTEAFQ